MSIRKVNLEQHKKELVPDVLVNFPMRKSTYEKITSICSEVGLDPGAFVDEYVDALYLKYQEEVKI